MSEKTEKQFEQFMKNQGMDKLRRTTREQFEVLMKKEGLEDVTGKEGYVFIIRGRDEADKDFKVLAEFETKEEMEDWYNSFGKLVEQGGGEIKIDFEFSKLGKTEEK